MIAGNWECVQAHPHWPQRNANRNNKTIKSLHKVVFGRFQLLASGEIWGMD